MLGHIELAILTISWASPLYLLQRTTISSVKGMYYILCIYYAFRKKSSMSRNSPYFPKARDLEEGGAGRIPTSHGRVLECWRETTVLE